MFRIPIIKVKSIGEDSRSHIVGTDSHDKLYIDEYTGGIYYHNIQCCASSQKVFEDGEDPDYAFEFEGVKGYFYDTEIEFITLEQLFELLSKEIQMDAERKIKFAEMSKKLFEDEAFWSEAVKETERKTGIRRL